MSDRYYRLAGSMVSVTRTFRLGGSSGGAVTPPASSTKLASLTDTFGSQDTAKWTKARTETLVNGQVVMPYLPSTGAFQHYRSVGRFDLTGSSLTIEVPEILGTTPSSETGVTLIASSTEEYQILVRGTNILFTSKRGTSFFSTSVAYDATTHRWWRIAEAGGTVTYSTSPDAASWTVQRTVDSTQAGAGSVEVLLFSGHSTAAETPTGTARFDNLNQPPPAAVSIEDTYTRADSSSLGTTEIGAKAYTVHSGVAAISGNRLALSQTGSTENVVSVDTGQATHRVKGTMASVPTSANYWRVAASVAGATTFVVAEVNPAAELKIAKRVAGTWTDVKTGATGIPAGAVIELVKRADNFYEVHVNGTLRLTTDAAITDTALTTATRVGFGAGIYGTGPLYFDNLVATASVAP